MTEFPKSLHFWTLDEVAECLSVSDDTYRALWAALPPDDTLPPPGEFPEPDSADRKPCLLRVHWARLPESVRTDVAQAAAANDAEWKEGR